MKRLQLRDEDLCPKPDPLYREKRLARAILTLSFKDLLDVNSLSFKKKAEKDIQTYFTPGSKLKDIAEDWFFSTDTTPGSFEWICQILEFSPGVIRLWIKKELPGLNQKERRNIAKNLPWRV